MSQLIMDDPVMANRVREEEDRLGNILVPIDAENQMPGSIGEAAGPFFRTKTTLCYPGRRFHTGRGVVV